MFISNGLDLAPNICLSKIQLTINHEEKGRILSSINISFSLDKFIIIFTLSISAQ